MTGEVMSGVIGEPQRHTTWLVTLLLTLCGVFHSSPGVAAGTRVTADEMCVVPLRVFAQQVTDGRLVEISGCQSPPEFGPAQLVSDDDWRTFRRVTAVAVGDAVVFYAVTGGGDLWWYRQAGPGLALSGPVRLAPGVDWSAVTALFVPEPGFLHSQDGVTVRTWAHPGWEVGGVELPPLDPLLTDVVGPSLSAAQWGRSGEGIHSGRHFRVWRSQDYPAAGSHPDVWYVSGGLPASVTGIVGSEPDLFGLSGSGAVVWLGQQNDRCLLFNQYPWVEAVRSPDEGFARIVAPVRRSPGQSPGLSPPPTGAGCGTEFRPPTPYEWQ